MNQLLSVHDAASAMATTSQAVQRLFARGHLKASRLGDSKDWQISAEELQRYNAAGRPDYRSPLSSSGTSFRENLTPIAERFRGAAVDACENQRLSAADFERLAASDRLRNSFDVKLRLTRELQLAAEKPFKSAEIIPQKEGPRYPTIGLAYCVAELRLSAQIVLQKVGKPLRWMYSSQENYLSTVSAAGQQFAQRKISFSELRHLSDGSGAYRLHYLLSNADFAGGQFAKVMELAF